MKYPLWAPTNTSEVSSLFVVQPGKCVVLSATGLQEYATRLEAGFRVPQMLCVERLLFDFAPSAIEKFSCGCDWIFDPVATKVMDDVVSVSGCYWALTHCNNIRIVGLPGTYHLRLNDGTAVGTVQVYAELFDASQIPVQMSEIFFQ